MLGVPKGIEVIGMAKITLPRQIKKRDGSVVPFDRQKIERAIERAAYEVLQDELKSARISSAVTDAVIQKVVSVFKNRIPTVEAVQDSVEAALMEEGYNHIAKAYILYRERRSEVRLAKSALGLKDDLKLPLNTVEVLRRCYLLKGDDRKVIETPSELFRRVASHIAQGERNFKSRVTPEEAEEHFYHMMRSLEFMPNSPTLMNAGTSLGQLSACFVIPVEDSVEGIFKALKDMARIHQTGGGTGFSFSRLRPQGDLVASTKGEASGPVSFMEIFDKATGVIVQGGRRRGANMGILRCDHPDILQFVEAKARDRPPFQFQRLRWGHGQIHGSCASGSTVWSDQSEDGQENRNGQGAVYLRSDRQRRMAYRRPRFDISGRDQQEESDPSGRRNRGHKSVRRAAPPAL